VNGYQRITAALAGQWPDVRPVMLHNFMMAAREAGVSMRRYRSDPHAIARVFIESVDRYGYDGILVDVDTATLAGAVGVPVGFSESEPAVCHGRLLARLEDAAALKPVDVGRYPGVQVWLEAVRILRRHFRDEVFVRGNCDQAAFSLAGMIRGLDDWLMDLMDETKQESCHQLLKYACGVSAQFLRLMADAGAHMVSNGDSSAGTSLISPRLHCAFAHPYERELADCAHGCGVPWALHVCGNATRILANLAATGADALELDFKTSVAAAHDALGGRATFIGNLDPTGVMARGTPAAIEAATRELLDAFSDTPRLILNAGCALPADTPPANLHALVAAAHARPLW
jgi:uroporphyrinogen decarboxylase